jgi:serine/threonine protein kinase
MADSAVLSGNEIPETKAIATPRPEDGTQSGISPLPPQQPAVDCTLKQVGQPRLWPQIEGYEIQALLGEGGMGSVYRAREIRLNRLVALKVIRAGLDSPEQRARFELEAQAVARMQHPNIVQIFAVGQWQPPGGPPLPYLAFEYLDGGDLEKQAGSRPMPAREAAGLVRTLALAMDHAHKKGIIHRDLKPANILLQTTDYMEHTDKKPEDLHAPAACSVLPVSSVVFSPKIADFGLARSQKPDAKLTRTGTVLGTVAYMAPEQADGLEVGPAADIYALGAILYRLLTGHVAFESNSLGELLYCICHREPVKPRQHVPGVPAALEAICLHCLAKKPAERYPDAAALAADLERFLASPAEAAAQQSTKVSKGWLLIAASMIALVLIGALVVVGLRGISKEKGVTGTETGGAFPAQPASKPESPLRLLPLTVEYTVLSADRKGAVAFQRMGDEAKGARFEDRVRLMIKLDAPLYCYVLAYRADGKEELLWPCDGSDEKCPGLPNVAPLQVSEIPRLPLGGKEYCLDEEPRGGLQVYVLAASRRPLPSYADWVKQRRPVGWQRQVGITGVWRADAAGTYAAVNGQPDERTVKPALGMPPLERLCQELQSGGVEAVEAIAFPVAAKR